MGSWAALACCACGTTLLPTRAPFSPALVARLKAAGPALGCHERASELFDLFLVCPGRDQVLGVAAVGDKLAISCPHLQHRGCRKLFERVQRAGR